jgi:hypothetical protein
MRVPLFVILAILLATPALADVVILDSNDVPLSGVILSETDTTLEFQIKGLGQNSRFTIDKSRIKKFWREKNSHWEFKDVERDHKEAVERASERKQVPMKKGPVLTFPLPEDLTPGRSNREVRADLIARTVGRVEAFVPDSLALRGLMALGGTLLLALLIFIGGRLADLPSLSIQKSLVLAFLAGIAVAAMIVVFPMLHLPPGLLPGLILMLTFVWLIAARVLSHGRFVKGAVMLSFVLATIFVAGSSILGILTVL